MYFAFHKVYHNVDLVLELHEILYIPFLVYRRWYYYKDFEYDTSYVIVILVSVIVVNSIYFTYPFFVDACLIHT